MTTTVEELQARLTRLERRLDRINRARQAAETLLEDKSRELYTTNCSLEGRNGAMQLILDTVDQGFITVDLDGNVCVERSARAVDWFGPAVVEPLLELFARQDPALAAWFEVGWEMLVEGLMPLEVCLEQLPCGIAVGDSELKIDWRPILADGKLHKVLVVFTDVTAARERERQEARQRQTFALLEHSRRDPHGLRAFVSETERLLGVLGGACEAQARILHTIKGNSALFGLESISQRCHELETRMCEAGQLAESDLEELRTAWASWQHTLELLAPSDTTLNVRRTEYEALRALVAQGAGSEQLEARLADWLRAPIEVSFERMADFARTLARRNGIPEPAVHLECTGVRVREATWRGFWAAFPQLIRNSLAHGLELPAERVASGKAEAGSLTLRARRSTTELRIELLDDGRGVAWDQVRELARRRGLPHSSHEDLVRALSAAALSTKDHADAQSGRGEGLGAVVAEAATLGGRLEVESTPGRGATFRFVFPLSAVDHAPGRTSDALQDVA